MQKRVVGQKLSRGRGARKALSRSLIRSLAMHGSINTTKSKAKFIGKELDKLMTLAKRDDLSARRRVYAQLGNDRKTSDLLKIIAERNFSGVKGGFTKVTTLGKRRGDNAEMVKLSWSKSVKGEEEKPTKKKTKKKEPEAVITSETKEEVKGVAKLTKSAKNIAPKSASSKALGAIKKGFRKAPSK